MTQPMEITQLELLDLIREIGDDGWTLYSVLASISVDGICEISQTELGTALNVSRKSINNRVLKLTTALVKNIPLLRTIKQRTTCIYVVTPIALGKIMFTVSDGVDASNHIVEALQRHLSTKHPLANSRGVIAYWRAQYLKRYDVEYYPSSWSRESSLINKKLLSIYSPEKLKAIIDVVMRLYDSKWKNSEFLRPTIGQLASWLATQAEPFAAANLKSDAISEPVEVASDDDELMKQLDRW